MTANAMAGDREACIAAGMNDHVAKPFQVDHLFATLMKWLPARGSTAPLPSLSAPAAASALPRLPGVDTAQGLAQTGGKAARYLDMLKRFQRGQAEAPQQIEAAMRDGEVELAVRLAHTLRGTAGTLGAEGLQRIAAELEAALKSGDAAWRQRLGETQAQLAPLVAALATHFEAADALLTPASPGASAVQRPTVPAALLQTLNQQIAQYDSQATETVAQLRDLLGTQSPAVLLQLDECLMNFAFDEATQLLPQLQALLHLDTAT